MEVTLTQKSRWDIDEEKIFIIYEDEWIDWKIEHGNTPISREKFLLDLLWQIVPHFEEVGGIETYEDANIDISFY